MQQQASRDHVIVRTSRKLPHTHRRCAIGLSDSAESAVQFHQFTGAGGQVIVSDRADRRSEARTGHRHRMSEKDLETALEPFRQVATVAHGSSTYGLGCLSSRPVEANHARFRIASEVGSGTLAEVAFPTTGRWCNNSKIG